MDDERILQIAIRLPIVLLALTVHEFCHAWFAYRMGDPTAYRLGRCTLNPLKHLDPLGTICLLFAPIGWAKPVPVNPLNFHDIRKGDLITSAAGPLSNLALAIAAALLLRVIHQVAPVGENAGSSSMASFNIALVIMAETAVYLNVGLAVFNFLPLYPLDGFHVAANLSRPETRQWMEDTRYYGPFVILGLVFFSRVAEIDLLGMIINPPTLFLFEHLVGTDPLFI